MRLRDIPQMLVNGRAALACLVIHLFHLSSFSFSGLQFVAALERFDAPRILASVPFILQQIVMDASGPIVGLLSCKFGPVPVTIVGILCSSIAMASCFFAESVTSLILVWGIGYGMFSGMAVHPLLPFLKTVFENDFPTASGLALAGTSLGGFILSPLYSFLLETYGFSGAYLVLSALALHCLPAAMFLNGSQRAEKKILRLRKNQCELIAEEPLREASKALVADYEEDTEINRAMIKEIKNNGPEYSESFDLFDAKRNGEPDEDSRRDYASVYGRGIPFIDADPNLVKNEDLPGVCHQYLAPVGCTMANHTNQKIVNASDKMVDFDLHKVSGGGHENHKNSSLFPKNFGLKPGVIHGNPYQQNRKKSSEEIEICPPTIDDFVENKNSSSVSQQLSLPNGCNIPNSDFKNQKTINVPDKTVDSGLCKVLAQRHEGDESSSLSPSKAGLKSGATHGNAYQQNYSDCLDKCYESGCRKTERAAPTINGLQHVTELSDQKSASSEMLQRNEATISDFSNNVDAIPCETKTDQISDVDEGLISSVNTQGYTSVSNPSHSVGKQQNNSSGAVGVLCDPVFLLIAFVKSSFLMALTIYTTILVDSALDRGVLVSESVYILMATCTADLLGHFCPGVLLGRGVVSATRLTSVALFCVGLTYVAFAFCKNFTSMLFVCTVSGFARGALFPVVTVVISEHFDGRRMTMAMTSKYILFVPLSFSISPIIGHFRDNIGSYNILLFSIGAYMVFSSLIILLLPAVAKHYHGNIKNKKNENIEERNCK